MTWQTLDSTPCALGESPFWHPGEHMLYWVDIAGRQILRANVYLGSVERWDMPSEPGCIAPAASGGLVIALRHGIFRADQWGGALRQIATLDYDTTRVRANDGKCDALGRFWVGTMDESRSTHDAALYLLNGRGGKAVQAQAKAGPATIANGLAWSPDGGTLYWADTPSHTVWAWDFEPQTASLQRQRVFASFEPKPQGWSSDDTGYRGRPDGAAVDVQGNYWVAMFEGQRLCQFAPDGRLLAEVPTPVRCPTMPCFGGEDLCTLYLSTARHHRADDELARYPESGCVFSMRVATPGLPVNFFAD